MPRVKAANTWAVLCVVTDDSSLCVECGSESTGERIAAFLCSQRQAGAANRIRERRLPRSFPSSLS